MSEEKQYLDEHWDDVPLPDEELAWQKMQLLMDKDKGRRRVLPIWFWRYAGVGLLLTALCIGGWYLVNRDQKASQISSASPITTSKPSDKNSRTTESNTVRDGEPIIKKEDVKIPAPQEPLVDNNPKLSRVSKGQVTKTKDLLVKKNEPARKDKKDPQILETKKEGSTNKEPLKKTTESTSITNPSEKQNSLELSKPVVVPKKDSVVAKDTIATKVAEPVAGKEKRKKEKKEATEDFVFSAGIGLQQAIAFDGQQTSSYNYKGKRNAISDRIPSVYVRLQKEKWFVQAEFQYAVPQPVKQFVFSQKTKYSVATQNLSTEQFTIQKLYYHQLPVTINYHLLPNLSVGTGAMYSILAGAVTEQEVTSKNVQTGNESVSRNITPVKGFKDSFLYKSTAGIVFQTDYHWKRLSFGLRYNQNLLSFIRYTTPNGDVLDEKNKTLQAILRFRLFEN